MCAKLNDVKTADDAYDPAAIVSADKTAKKTALDDAEKAAGVAFTILSFDLIGCPRIPDAGTEYPFFAVLAGNS